MLFFQRSCNFISQKAPCLKIRDVTRIVGNPISMPLPSYAKQRLTVF